MVILTSKNPSGSSATGDSDGPSDDDQKRLYKQPSGPRKTSSPSSSGSDSEDPPASNVSQPKRAVGESSPQPKRTAVGESSPTKVKKDGKRKRGEVAGQEEPAAKRKSAPKKPSPSSPPPRQHETLPKGAAEKTLVKSAMEKKEKNPRRQQIVQEAAASTPVKKVQHLWSDKDEMVFVNALLACSKRGIDVSKSLSQVHQDLKGSMEYEYTKGQLYEKLRRLKNKYHTTVEKMKESNEKEDSYHFKTPHDKAIFRICKQLWDEEEEMEEAPRKPAKLVPREGDANDNDRPDSGEEEKQEDGNRTVSAQQDVKGPADDKMPLINELRTDCMKMIEAAEAQAVALVEKLFKSARESLHPGDGGIRAIPVFSIINRELMDGILGGRGVLLLEGARAENLEHKWREQNIVEIETFSRRLHLLQEECKMYLEGLKSPAGSGRS